MNDKNSSLAKGEYYCDSLFNGRFVIKKPNGKQYKVMKIVQPLSVALSEVRAELRSLNAATT